MPKQREPIDLLLAKGRKHLTKEEIRLRKLEEVAPIRDDVVPPAFLTAKQKSKFRILAAQLDKLRILGETDCDALGRYVEAESAYETETKTLRKLQKQQPDYDSFDQPKDYYAALRDWNETVESVSKRQNRNFTQAQAAARELGLTISSRCRLVVPQAEEEPPENKFAKFRKAE